MKDLNQKSKYLSLLLRHKPENANLTMDEHGWVKIDQLVKNTSLTESEIDEIVKTDNKQRYSIVNGSVRANQGHSIKWVDLQLKSAMPPITLYHGTKASLEDTILREGLKKMNRQHVHLSADEETAENVAGRRRTETIVLMVEARRMHNDGYMFYLSENGVWLTDHVPAKYIV